MANFTPNYNLKKPLGYEHYNKEDDNGNMDLIDAALKAQADLIATNAGDIDDLETNNTGVNTGDQTASEVPVVDTAGNFTATDVEGALAETAQIVSTNINKITQLVRPRKILNVDDFSVDNSLYQNASNLVNSTAVMNTTTKELTVTSSGSHHISPKAHKSLTYGKNIMINTTFKADTALAQVHLRVNQKNSVGTLIWFQPTGTATIQLQRVNDESGGYTSIITPAVAFDGTAHIDTDVSIRSFGSMSEMIIRQGGIVRGMFRNVSSAFGALSGIANGLGATTTPAVYKTELKQWN